jgi:hypothetical protein
VPSPRAACRLACWRWASTKRLAPGGSTQINATASRNWGTTATAAANTFYMLARNADGRRSFCWRHARRGRGRDHWEFKLATFTIDVGGVGTGSTSFNIIQPNAKATVGAQTYATRRSTTRPSTSPALLRHHLHGQHGRHLRRDPEPASIGLLGAAAVGLLGRRRK